jgi:Cu/Ag efflux pump CusA
VIVGGLLVGTVFTLYVIPTAYMLLVGRGRAPAAKAQAHAAAAE